VIFDALTDLYALLPQPPKGKPLLRKKRRSVSAAPGLTGAALEREVDRWAAIFPGRVH
jgi:hypothetical protein